MENNKPKIIRGTCEFCGVPAYKCIHWQGLVDQEGKLLPAEDRAEISEPKIENSEKKTTPFNCKLTSKKILIGCVDFSNLTGMPMYLYNLGKELIKLGYEISLVSTIGGKMAELAANAGFRLFNWNQDYRDDYMALLLNEPISERLLSEFPDTPAYNIIHSARPEDEPIPNCPQIRKYFYVKLTDLDYIKGKVPEHKCEQLPIPIDFERFNKTKRKKHDGYVILAPCTFDQLRKPMLKDLVRRAKEDPSITVILKGKNYGVISNPSALPKNVIVDENPDPNIENFMAEADEVAGILLGTVTLEAWAMGLKTSVYDLEGNFEMVKAPTGFKSMYSAKSVAEKLSRILNEKWADIIIPHHDQSALLAQTLNSIPLRNYNVFVVRGGYFAQSCNRGSLMAQTNNLIFANDDLIIGSKVLWEMLDNEADVVGVRQNYPDGQPLGIGIFINEFGNYELTANTEKAQYPSGALFKIKRQVWDNVGGFDERFINGGEDQDLFLKCLEAGFNVGFVETPVVHYCSKSTGRFDFINENDQLLFGLWPEERLKKFLGDNYRLESDVAKKDL